MAHMPEKFAELLTVAVRTIAVRRNRTVASIQDELGYILGREGGSAIEYWRKGHVPANLVDLELLAETLVKQNGLNQAQLELFLRSGGHPSPEAVSPRLFLSLTPGSPAPNQPARQLSPFIVGLPITRPRQFFGRERELKRIFALWRRFPLQNVALIGWQRSGKSSLLHYLKTITQTPAGELRPGQRHDWLPQPERYRWIFIDFQDARMGNRERLLRYLLAGLELPIPEPCNLDNFMDVMSRRLRSPAIILMDEIGAGLAAPELDQSFWWSLRSLVSHYTQGNLAFGLTSHRSPAQLAEAQGKPSPFFNLFYTLELGPLTDEEAQALVASSPKPFPPVDIAWILEQSGGWPCLLQILGQTRLIALEEGQTDQAWREDGLRQIEPFRYLLA